MQNKLFSLLFIATITAVIFSISSCHDSQYVIKQTDKKLKYSYAEKFYLKENYYQAIPVIEDLMPYFKGSDTAERLYFMLSESYFYNKEFMVAAYHYKQFRDLYPRSYKSEVALYKIAECYRKDVPRIELEQTDTEKAIEYYKAFIAEYPTSSMAKLAIENIESLKRNLELKALGSAELYYRTGNYRAAALSFKNVLSQYPKIKEYEDLMYKIALSSYKFAEKSITTKQSERYEAAMNDCQNFINRFPTSNRNLELTKVMNDSKVKILESALRNAHTYYIVDERPFYYNQSLELYNEFLPEFKTVPTQLNGYKDKCYLGIVKSYYTVLEEVKDNVKRKENYQLFIDNYYRVVERFSAKSTELREAEELYKKANQYYKS